MANEVKIDIVANSQKFEIAIENAVKKVQEFGIKNRELASVVDSEYGKISRAANSLSGELGSAFNSLKIPSDFGLDRVKQQLEADKLFFKEQFNSIASSANASMGETARAMRSLNFINASLNAQPLKNEFKTLGIESAASIEASKVKIRNAFAEISASGTASFKDITRAHKAMNLELSKLDSGPIEKATGGFNLLSLASVAAIAKIQVMYMAINNVIGAIASAPSLAVDAIENFNASAIKNSAIITSMVGDVNNIGEAYKQNKTYADAVQNSLIKMDATTIASYKQLQIMNDAFVQQGVFIDVNNKKQLDGYRNIANALATITANMPNADMQFSQEIRAMMQGESRPGDQLFKQLVAIDPKLKEHLAEWKQIAYETNNSGYILEKIGPLLAGYAAASGDINGLWTTIKSTLSTIRDEVLRGGLSEGFKEIVEMMKELAKWAEENKTQIQQFLKDAFQDAKFAAKLIWDISKAMASLAEPAMYVAAAIGIGKITTSIMGAVTAMKAFAAAQALTGAGGVAGSLGALSLGAKAGLVGGVGLGSYYLASKAVKGIDSFLYHKTGLNFTGETMYDESQAKDAIASKRLAEVMAKKQQAAVVVPNAMKPPVDEKAIQLDDSIRKAKLAQDESYKNLEKERTKQAAAYDLEINEENYAKGLISLQTYLDKKHAVNQQALQDQIKEQKKMVSAYGQEAATYSGRGESKDDLKYAETMKKVNEAYKTQIQLEGQLKVAKAKNAEEDRTRTKAILDDFTKQHIAIIELTGDYEAATQDKINLEKGSDSYAKLVALSHSSDVKIKQAAEQALADKEQMWASDSITNSKKTFDETRKQVSAINELKTAYDTLMGRDSSTSSASKKYSDGLVASEQLELELKKAINDKDEKLTENLRERLALQNKINSATGEEYNNKIRAELLKGGIVGFSSSAVTEDNKAGAIFINDFKQVADYISNKELLNADKNSQAGDKSLNAASTMSAAGNSMVAAGATMMSSANLSTSAITGFYKYADVANSSRWAVETTVGPSYRPVVGGWGVNPLTPTAFTRSSSLTGRATGGDVDAYTPYIVGEKGPELFMTKQAGSIIPNNKLNSANNSGASNTTHIAGGVSVVLPNVQSAHDYDAIANGVLAKLKVKNSRFI